MELHMSFFCSPFLPSEPPEPEALVYVEKRLALVAAMVVAWPDRHRNIQDQAQKLRLIAVDVGRRLGRAGEVCDRRCRVCGVRCGQRRA